MKQEALITHKLLYAWQAAEGNEGTTIMSLVKEAKEDDLLNEQNLTTFTITCMWTRTDVRPLHNSAN